MVRPTGPVPGISCAECGTWFQFKRYGVGHKWHYNRKQRFCTKSCADKAQTSEEWGTDQHGYKIRNRVNDAGKRGYVFQHREVMEEHIGRKLFPHETVHHKDGNRANNELSNLELWSSRHGKGQ